MMPVVCVVKVAAPLNNEVVQLLMPLAPPEKQARIHRQRIRQNADNMLVGAALARHLLWREFRIPHTAEISCGPYGKPCLPDYPEAHFNISHSGQYVACAVYDRPIGVDVQTITPYCPDVARRVCTKAELMQIENSMDQAEKFTELWTRKEAYLKMLGCGLSVGLELPTDQQKNTVIRTARFQGAFITVQYYISNFVS